MEKRRIDLRPHYAFAYFSESMEFRSKYLLFYSMKDKALHILYESGEYGYIVGDAVDWELIIYITEEDAKLLEMVFSLFIEACRVFQKSAEKLWCACDGSFCTVICGRERVHYEWPCVHEPINSFNAMANELLRLKENCTQKKIRRIVKLAKAIEKQLVV